MSLKTLTEKEAAGVVCAFCKQNTVDELRLGPLYHRDDLTVHYFCMLFAAALNQGGSDEDGVLGFLPADIARELRRSRTLKCYYCEGLGASIGCCKKKCRKGFHFPCGLNNGVNYHFFGKFESYCTDHAKDQKITSEQSEWECPVCMIPVLTTERPIQASCCKAAVFHTECMQKVAINAGYFFKCPTCNASQNFVQEMRSLGIYVPQQDASWEREPNAFQDLYYQYSNCDSENCLCPKGKKYNQGKGPWAVVRCRICGSSAVHSKCGSVDGIEDWACSPCIEMERKADEETKRIQKERAEQKAKAEDEIEEDSDSDLEDFSLAKITIRETCKRYFPYESSELKQFDRNRYGVPDWRNLELAVNLCDWIKFVTPPEDTDLCNSSKVKETASHSQNSSSGQSDIHISESSSVAEANDNDSSLMQQERLIEATTNEVENQKALEENIDSSSVSTNVACLQPSNSKDMPIENSLNTKQRCAIFPFVTNFLKSGLLIRDKRKLSMTPSTAPYPPKKPLLDKADTRNYNLPEKNNTGDMSKPDVIKPVIQECDDLCAPTIPFAEKQVVLWENKRQPHDTLKKCEFSTELEDFFDKTPSPQSLIFSVATDNTFGLANQSVSFPLMYNTCKNHSGSSGDKRSQVSDVNMNSSRQPNSELEISSIDGRSACKSLNLL